MTINMKGIGPFGKLSSPPDSDTISVDEVLQNSKGPKDAQSHECQCDVIDASADDEQVRERWYRDPWGRQNTQSVTKAIDNQRNLEEAMYSRGFSRARASKAAYYLARCEGQFQEWDFIVKKQPRLKNRVPQEDDVSYSTSKILQGQLGYGPDENAEEALTEKDSDIDGNETMSMAEVGRRRSSEPKSAVSVGASPLKAARKPRSQKDERQRKRDRKSEALRFKEYACYRYEDYAQAARRFDIIYGSADELYRLAEEKEATREYEAQQKKNQPWTEMEIQGKLVEVEDPTFGITQPSVEEALTPEERKARDHEQKQLWAKKKNETLARSLEKLEMLQGNGMFN